MAAAAGEGDIRCKTGRKLTPEDGKSGDGDEGDDEEDDDAAAKNDEKECDVNVRDEQRQHLLLRSHRR